MALLLSIPLTALLGWSIIGRWLRCGWIPAVSLGFAAGVGLLSLEMFFFGLLRLPWRPALILLPWVPVIYAARYTWPRYESPRLPNWLEWIAIASLLPAPLAWLPYERVMPLNTRNWDAWAIWLFKARAFYLDGNLAGFLSRAAEFDCQPSYPLLIPLYGTFLYRLSGSAADQLAKFVTPCFFFALLGAFYYLARRFASRPVALVFTAMLSSLHMLDIVSFELAGYADTTLAVYVLLGAGFLYAWWRDAQPSDLTLASLFASLAAWTKNEGIFFLGGIAALVALRLARNRSAAPARRAWILAVAWPLLAVVPWIVARHIYRVPGAGLLAGNLVWQNLGPGLAGILGQAVKINVYNLTFWFLAASLLLARRAALGSSWWLLPGLVGWQLIGLLGAYLSVPNDIHWWIGTSLDRILSQVAPLALLAPAIALGAYVKAPPPPAPAPAPKPSSRRSQRKR